MAFLGHYLNVGYFSDSYFGVHIFHDLLPDHFGNFELSLNTMLQVVFGEVNLETIILQSESSESLEAMQVFFFLSFRALMYLTVLQVNKNIFIP